MSRTYRRMKNDGRKYRRYYCPNYAYGVGRLHFRDEDEEKKHRENQVWYHRDHGSSVFSPSRYYRKVREGELRAMSRAELHRFKTREDYEVMIPDDPVDCLWDWL